MNTTDVQALGRKASSVSTTGEKTNAGKVLSCVYLLLNISPSSPNPNSGSWGEGEPDSLAPLLLPHKGRFFKVGVQVRQGGQVDHHFDFAQRP